MLPLRGDSPEVIKPSVLHTTPRHHPKGPMTQSLARVHYQTRPDQTRLKSSQSPDVCQGCLSLPAPRGKSGLERNWNTVERRRRQREASRHLKTPHRPIDANGVWIRRRCLSDRNRLLTIHPWSQEGKYSRDNPLTHASCRSATHLPAPGGARSSHDSQCCAESHEKVADELSIAWQHHGKLAWQCSAVQCSASCRAVSLCLALRHPMQCAWPPGLYLLAGRDPRSRANPIHT